MNRQKGNKNNAVINREYGKVKKWLKKFTSRMRRIRNKKILKQQMEEI